MNCHKGCSHCCVGGLSIFAWEAELIISWFHGLAQQERQQWLKNFDKAQEPFTDVTGQSTEPCSFLSAGACTIYSARPIICRTQGMGLKWHEEGSLHRDVCPLNFTDENQPPSDVQDELNLDVINHMMSQAQSLYEQDSSSSRQLPTSHTRVELAFVKEYLIKLANS